MLQNANSIIQQIIAPATMVPACGLLILSSTVRMNTALGRVRAFHTERLEVWSSSTEPGSRHDAVRRLRLEGLAFQTQRLLRRCRLLQFTMLTLFVAVGCNLLSMIALAVHSAVPDATGLSVVATGLFVLGVLAFLVAVISSIAEVSKILETLGYEHRRVERLCETPAPAISDEHDPHPSDPDQPTGGIAGW